MVQTAEGNLDEVHSILQRSVSSPCSTRTARFPDRARTRSRARSARWPPRSTASRVRAVQRHRAAGHRNARDVPGRRQRRPGDLVTFGPAADTARQLRWASTRDPVLDRRRHRQSVPRANGSAPSRRASTTPRTWPAPTRRNWTSAQSRDPDVDMADEDGQPDQEPGTRAGRAVADAGPGEPGPAGRPGSPALGRTNYGAPPASGCSVPRPAAPLQAPGSTSSGTISGRAAGGPPCLRLTAPREPSKPGARRP